MKTFNEENNTLINSFFEHTFFRGWKRDVPEFNRLEVEIGPTSDSPKVVLANLNMLLNWLAENKYRPGIDFFSKESFAQALNLQALRLIIDSYKNRKTKSKIIVPTNYTFLESEEKKKAVESLLKHSKEVKVPIHLSISEDLMKNKYSDKCFIFNKRWNFEFYPIIRPQFIKNCENNFLWFHKKLEEFNISPQHLHLSEAKNEEWQPDQLNDFMDFIEFLVEWTYHVLYKNNKNRFANALLLKERYDILSNPFSNQAKFYSQKTVRVILDRLIITSGNKTSHTTLTEAKFKIKNKKIVELESDSPEMLIGRMSTKETTLPYCETCLLKYLCQRNYLSSQLNTTGDLFSPIPTVCKLEHAKIYSLIKAFEKFDLYNLIYSKLNPERKYSLNIIRELLSKK